MGGQNRIFLEFRDIWWKTTSNTREHSGKVPLPYLDPFIFHEYSPQRSDYEKIEKNLKFRDIWWKTPSNTREHSGKVPLPYLDPSIFREYSSIVI